jgi:hypothetical protein
MANRVNAQMEMIDAAEKAMEIRAQHVFEDRAPEADTESKHHHIAIAWRGGVVWLDMSDLGDHFCIDVRQFAPADAEISERLEYLRQELRAERISMGELIELQGLAKHIEPGDLELLEAAGVSEEEATSHAKAAAVNLAGQGVFTIVNGRRQQLGSANEHIDDGSKYGKWITHEEPPLADPDGTPVKGHGWNGGYVVTLMHDKDAATDKQTNRPAGSGRG